MRQGLPTGIGLACAIGVAWTALPAAAAFAAAEQRAVRALNARGPLGDERLSDERRVSR